MPFSARWHSALLIPVLFLLLPVILIAQDTPIGPPGLESGTTETPAAANTDALRKAAQNPIANLISVPVQNNNNFGIGPDDRIQDILNIQPVIPMRISENWNLISRIITPIIYQPTTTQPVNQGAAGFGDLNPSLLLSPAKPHKIKRGVGPTRVFTTTTQ